MTCDLRALQVIPTHVGKLHAARQMGYATAQQAKAGKRWSFVAGFIESLQAEADAEKVRTARDGVTQWLAQSMRVQSGDQSATVAHAREDEAFGFGNRLRPVGGDDVRAQAAQGAFHRGDIAGAVIEQGDVHGSSLVLGKTLRRRVSRETAKRSARANALNSASTWWCEERP